MIALPSIFQWLILMREPFNSENESSVQAMYMVYVTVGKPLYFFGLIIIVVFCLLNKLKWITTIIGNYIWGPLTELSYSAYLVHFFIIVWYYSSLTQTLFINIPDLLFTSVAVIFASFVVAIPFSFLIEIPSKNLMELILLTMKKYRDNEEEEEIDAKANNSSGREKVGFTTSSNANADNYVSNASANLMFLSGTFPEDLKDNKGSKLKVD
mmetsp:Transcript_852/g.1009  ORF Transcript_852/g.1009 Transcript_852/m.1009 type:complete len:211 (-) Transcript_852:23-655(-)